MENKNKEIKNNLLVKLEKYFEFSKHKTNFKVEILAGLSTFMALSYIFVVNPAILGGAGFNVSAVLFASIITSFLSTLVMGLWAKKPFVLAPGMEMNAYVAFFVVIGLGYSSQQALGAVFWSGIIFMILTLSGIRTKIINSIPNNIKLGLSLCVGVFLMIIALRLSEILIYDGILFSGVGVFTSSLAYVFYLGLGLILLLKYFKVKGAVLISIVASAIFANYMGLGNTGNAIEFSTDMFSSIFTLDFSVILDYKLWGVILVLFLVDFYGSVAKFIGLTRNTSIVDKDGKLPLMKETLSVDGYATLVGSVLGTTSLTTYVESGVGISEGGRTGFTAVVCSILMLLFMLLAPLVNMVPVIATTGALFFVGISMFPSREELKYFTKFDILIISTMIITPIVTFTIDKALLFGFILFILGCFFKKNFSEVNGYLYTSTLLLLVGLVLSF